MQAAIADLAIPTLVPCHNCQCAPTLTPYTDGTFSYTCSRPTCPISAKSANDPATAATHWNRANDFAVR
jgi:hypothetical protein